MVVAIHQPDYIPYLGYFYKISKCDRFIFLEDAQYSNTGYTGAAHIKTAQGQLRLKIPVKQTLGDLIYEVTTKDSLKWKQKHLKTIAFNYKKADYFEQIYTDFENLLLKEYQNISEMNREIIMFISRKLGFQTDFLVSSQFKIHTKKEERVIELCKMAGASHYFSGMGASIYQKDEDFSKAGMKLVYTDYRPIVYRQFWGSFIENLSILDFLFYYGYNWKYVQKQVEERKQKCEG